MRKFAFGKFSAVLFTAAMVLAFGVAAWAEYWNEGHSGDSWEDAYIIDSVEDFKEMAEFMSGSIYRRGKYFKLAADITLDFSDYEQPDGEGYVDGYLEGHFDGQSHTITLNFDRGNKNAALFDTLLPNDSIKNLNVVGTVKGGKVAGIVLTSMGVIENCTFKGTVQGRERCAGGIVGDGVSCVNCSFSGTVKMVGENNENTFAGGILGEYSSNGGRVENCKVETGSIVSASAPLGYVSAAGGIIGIMVGGYVANCTSNATISDAVYKGGIIGELIERDDIDNVRSNITGNSFTGAEVEIGNDAADNSDESGDDTTPVTPTPDNGNTTPVVPDTPSNGGENNSDTTDPSIISLPTITLERVELTETLVKNIVTQFSKRNITAANVLTPWDTGAEIGDAEVFTTTDRDTINPNQALAALQSFSVTNPGVYVFGANLSGIKAGTNLTAWGKTSSAGVAVELADAERAQNASGPITVYFDRNGNKVTEVPADQYVIMATYTAANTKKGLFVLQNNELPIAIVEPVTAAELTDEMKQEIATALSIDVSELRYITEDNLDHVAPEEPTQTMKSEVRKENYEFAAKLDTITVNEAGYYVFKVNLPEELKGIKLNDMALYATEGVNSSGKAARLAAIPGIISLIGNAADGFALFRENWYITVLLPAAQPLSLYILKILLLLAGCDAGLGLGAIGLFAVGGMLLLKVWKRR